MRPAECAATVKEAGLPAWANQGDTMLISAYVSYFVPASAVLGYDPIPLQAFQQNRHFQEKVCGSVLDFALLKDYRPERNCDEGLNLGLWL